MKTLGFEKGKLFERDAPAEWEDKQSSTDYYESLGYISSQVFGDEVGLHLKLWEHKEGGARFLVEFNTCHHGTEIFCNSWLDLIELLAMLSPVAIAGSFAEIATGTAMPVVIREKE